MIFILLLLILPNINFYLDSERIITMPHSSGLPICYKFCFYTALSKISVIIW